MSLNVFLYKQALDLVYPHVMLSYMRGNLELMLKIYIFHHK